MAGDMGAPAASSDTLTTLGGSLSDAFSTVGSGVVAVLPKIVLAIVIFVAGWIIAAVIARVIEQVFKAIKIDRALEAAGLGDLVSRAGYTLNSGAFIGALVKWFVIVAFLIVSLDLVGLSQVNDFLQGTVVYYLPKVIAAALVLVIGGILAEVVQKGVAGSVRAAGVHSAGFFSGIARWAVWVFTILIALQHLGVVGPFAQTLFTGFVAMIAIAGGIAFGMGGRDAAARYIEKLREEISTKR